MAAVGWFYWLIISKITTASEIGEATTVFGIINLTISIVTLGIEYPLLKRSSSDHSKIFMTALITQLAISLSSMLVIFVVMDTFYSQDIQQYALIAIAMLAVYSVTWITRFSLLGISNVKSVLLIDSISNGVRLATGFLLVSIGLGALGILLSLLLEFIVFAALSFFPIKKFFAFQTGGMSYAKELLKEGASNIPSKLSRLAVLNLSVILLALFGISTTEIGIFYIALTISIVAGGFASSLAYMTIPSSSVSKSDQSYIGMRVGLSLTAPFIALLVVAPGSVLSLIGNEYVSASMILPILAISIFPSTILMNTISRLNNLGKHRILVMIGSIQMVSFLLSFWYLVPIFGIQGSAISILISVIVPSILSLAWAERASVKSIAIAAIAVACGSLLGLGLNQVIALPVLSTLTSVGVTLAIIFGLRNFSITEMIQIVKSVAKA